MLQTEGVNQRRSEHYHEQKTIRWLEKELYTSSTERHALLMGAQIKLEREECVLGMGQRKNDAAVKDAQIKLRREECVLGMEQHGQRSDAAAMDAQIKLLKEECA